MERTIETVQLFGSLLIALVVLFVPITIGIVLLQRRVGPERLQRWLGGSSLPLALLKGTALGAVTPFCGCSTVPLLLGLLKANVRFAAVAAFVLASPLLNPYLLGVVTLLFGWRTALIYAGVAVVTTLVLATLWEVAGLHRHIKVPGYLPTDGIPGREQPALALVGVGGRGPVDAQSATSAAGLRACGICTDGDTDGDTCGICTDGDTCGGVGAGESACGRAEPLDAWRGLRVEVESAWGEAVGLLRPMVRPLAIGMAIGALIYGAVPEGAFASMLGTSTWLTLPLAAVLGLPLYLRGEAAFPIGAALLAAGVGAGPMFAMVIAGMGASIPEVTLLSGIFDRKLLGVFLASVFTMAIAGGLLIPPLV